MPYPIVGSLVGLLSGLHAASWGMYKDAPHEGFELRKYLRSPVLGAVIGAAAAAALPLDPRSARGVALLFGVAYAVERALAEIYKTFLREEDQAKYTIPMQLAVGGRVVQSRALRLVLGAGYLGLLLGLVLLLDAWQRSRGGAASLAEVVLLGGAGGWISAFGGAWKDAPVEGFQSLKFLRSPMLAAGWALVLYRLTPDLVTVMVAAIGYTVATTETWKTFFFPSRPRGKFAGKPVRFPAILRHRQHVVPVCAAVWLLVLASLGIALGGDAAAGSAVVEWSHD